MFSPQEFDLVVRANTVAIAQDTCLENVLECLLYRIRTEAPLDTHEAELMDVARAINPDVDGLLSTVLNRLERYAAPVFSTSAPLAA